MPYLPDARQYRSFAATNFQPIDRGEEQSYVVKGHFTTFESEYQLCGNFYEVIDRTALDNAGSESTSRADGARPTFPGASAVASCTSLSRTASWSR